MHIVRYRNGFVQIMHSDDAGHRPEYLFLVDPHAVIRIDEQRWLQIKAVVRTLQPIAAREQFCALIASHVNVAKVFR